MLAADCRADGVACEIDDLLMQSRAGCLGTVAELTLGGRHRNVAKAQARQERRQAQSTRQRGRAGVIAFVANQQRDALQKSSAARDVRLARSDLRIIREKQQCVARVDTPECVAKRYMARAPSDR